MPCLVGTVPLLCSEELTLGELLRLSVNVAMASGIRRSGAANLLLSCAWPAPLLQAPPKHLTWRGSYGGVESGGCRKSVTAIVNLS